MKKRLFIVVNDVLPLLDTRAAEGNTTVVGTDPNLKKYDKETAMKNLPEMEAAFEFPQTKEYLDKLGIRPFSSILSISGSIFRLVAMIISAELIILWKD